MQLAPGSSQIRSSGGSSMPEAVSTDQLTSQMSCVPLKNRASARHTPRSGAAAASACGARADAPSSPSESGSTVSKAVPCTAGSAPEGVSRTRSTGARAVHSATAARHAAAPVSRGIRRAARRRGRAGACGPSPGQVRGAAAFFVPA